MDKNTVTYNKECILSSLFDEQAFSSFYKGGKDASAELVQVHTSTVCFLVLSNQAVKESR